MAFEANSTVQRLPYLAQLEIRMSGLCYGLLEGYMAENYEY
jgi:hypothetical protein